MNECDCGRCKQALRSAPKLRRVAGLRAIVMRRERVGQVVDGPAEWRMRREDQHGYTMPSRLFRLFVAVSYTHLTLPTNREV